MLTARTRPAHLDVTCSHCLETWTYTQANAPCVHCRDPVAYVDGPYQDPACEACITAGGDGIKHCDVCDGPESLDVDEGYNGSDTQVRCPHCSATAALPPSSDPCEICSDSPHYGHDVVWCAADPHAFRAAHLDDAPLSICVPCLRSAAGLSLHSHIFGAGGCRAPTAVRPVRIR